jgi:hypothetical protein
MRDMKRGEKNENKEKSGPERRKMPLDNAKMGDYAEINPDDGEITPETDGIEAIPGRRIEFGFSFQAEEGREGEEIDYYGDMTKDQKAVGNIFDSTLGTGRTHSDINEEEAAAMHFADESNIGMAYGKDKYVEEENKDKRGKQRGEDDEKRRRR